MKVLIIEDEIPAAKRLRKLISQYCPEAKVMDVVDSVEGATQWLDTFEKPDLIFMDIQLSDGLSFDIFNQTEVISPVIFTTAYDQYALKAFKVNSVDYLLKPIDPEELQSAFAKFRNLHQQAQEYDRTAIQNLISSITQKGYKERFLVKVGQQLNYVQTKEIAYFYSEEGLVYAMTNTNRRHVLDYTLEQLQDVLDPKIFFRINRKIIVSVEAIHKIHTYFNSRLKLELLPRTELEAIVSRERVGDFKSWLDN